MIQHLCPVRKHKFTDQFQNIYYYYHHSACCKRQLHVQLSDAIWLFYVDELCSTTHSLTHHTRIKHNFFLWNGEPARFQPIKLPMNQHILYISQLSIDLWYSKWFNLPQLEQSTGVNYWSMTKYTQPEFTQSEWTESDIDLQLNGPSQILIYSWMDRVFDIDLYLNGLNRILI